MIRKSFIAILAAMLAGCAVKPKMISSNYVPPQKIAVLPMANLSNDLQGPEYIRQEFIRHLTRHGYRIIDAAQTDEILRTKLGITDGGQLGSSTPQKICEALGVDAAVYGQVIDFKFQNIGFYQNKYVEVSFKMVDRRGEALWEDQRKASHKELALSPEAAKRALVGGLVNRAVGKMLKVPLYEEVQTVVRVAVASLPKNK